MHQGAASLLWPLDQVMNVGSAIAGAIGGGYAGAKAWTGKDASIKKVLDAQSQRNAARMSHQTIPGKIMDSAFGMLTGQSLATAGNKVLENTKKASELVAKLKSATEEEGIKNGAAVNYTIDGHNVMFDGEQWDNAWKGTTGNDFEYQGIMFQKSRISSITIDDAKKKQVQAWMSGGAYKTGGKSYKTMTTGTEKLASMVTSTKAAVKDAAAEVRTSFDSDNLSTYGKTIGTANVYVSNTESGSNRAGMQQKMRNANNQQKK